MGAQGHGQGDDAIAADDVVDVGLDGPAGGLGGFEFEAGDGFDGVAVDGDFDFVGAEFLGEVDGSGEGAVAFAVEAGGEGGDGGGEDGVVGGVEGIQRE